MNNRENRRVLLPLGVGALILLVVFFAIPSGALFPVSDKAGVDKVGRNPVELAHEPELRALNREGAGANCEADDPSSFAQTNFLQADTERRVFGLVIKE